LHVLPCLTEQQADIYQYQSKVEFHSKNDQVSCILLGLCSQYLFLIIYLQFAIPSQGNWSSVCARLSDMVSHLWRLCRYLLTHTKITVILFKFSSVVLWIYSTFLFTFKILWETLYSDNLFTFVFTHRHISGYHTSLFSLNASIILSSQLYNMCFRITQKHNLYVVKKFYFVKSTQFFFSITEFRSHFNM
jgi:hypothetical protein